MGFRHSGALAAVLERAARDRAGSVAYVFRDEALTLGELWEQTSALVANLVSIGLQPDDRVALALPSGLDFIRMFWAVQRTGASACAFNPHAPAGTLIHRVKRVRPRLLIASDDAIVAAAMIEQLPVVTPRDSITSHAIPPTPSDPGRLAFLQPTSGTSGEPRAVMIRHENVLAFLESSTSALSFGPADIFVGWVPPWHDLGLVRFVIGNVYSGARCHIVPPAIQTIPEWLRTIHLQRGTVTGAPDFAWRLASRLVSGGDADLSSLRYATNGGEPVNVSTIERFEQRFGIRGVLRPGYGLAEATLGVSTVRPGEPLIVDERGHVSCGAPFAGVEVRTDVDGEILVRGPGVFAGYFDAEQATVDALDDGWLRTGDYGRVDDSGQVYVLGRKRAMIKRGGSVLAPRELEDLAFSIPGVKVAAAVGVALRSGDGTEEIALALETDEASADEMIVIAVRDKVRDALGFAPEHIVILPKHGIPRTHNGKVRHAELSRRIRERPEGALAISRPVSSD